MTKLSANSTNGFPLVLLLTGGVGFIPLFFSRATIDPALAPRFTAWAVFIVLLILAILSRPRSIHLDLSLGKRGLFLAAASYVLLSASSLAQAINLAEGMFELLKILLATIFLFLATVILGAHLRSISLLAKAMTLAAIVLTFIGICQYYLLAFNSIPGNYLVYATMANKNLLASALILMLAFVLLGALDFAGIWRALSLIALALTGFCLFIIHSRAAWLAVALATLGIASFLAATRLHFHFMPVEVMRYRQRLAQILALTVVVTAIAALSHARYITTETSVAKAFARPLSSIDERLTLWTKTWQMIQEHPVLGVGLGNWKIVIPRYGTDGLRSEFGTVHFQRPHNDFLWILSESGPLALLAYFTYFGIAILYVFKIVKRARNEGDKLTALLMLWGLLGYLTVAGFDFPKERIEHTIFVTLILAVILSIYHRLYPVPHKSTRFFTPVFVTGVLAVSIVAVTAGFLRCRAERHTQAALQARDAGDWERVILEIDGAESLFANLDPTAAPLRWYKGVAQFSLQRVDEALLSFHAAYALHPNHLFVLNNLATCHELKGDHAHAIALYQKALAISPHIEETLLNLSAVYFAMQNYQQAYQTLQRCDPASQNPKVHSYLHVVKAKLEETGQL